jgi:hypothetical protein
VATGRRHLISHLGVVQCPPRPPCHRSEAGARSGSGLGAVWGRQHRSAMQLTAPRCKAIDTLARHFSALLGTENAGVASSTLAWATTKSVVAHVRVAHETRSRSDETVMALGNAGPSRRPLPASGPSRTFDPRGRHPRVRAGPWSPWRRRPLRLLTHPWWPRGVSCRDNRRAARAGDLSLACRSPPSLRFQAPHLTTDDRLRILEGPPRGSSASAPPPDGLKRASLGPVPVPPAPPPSGAVRPPARHRPHEPSGQREGASSTIVGAMSSPKPGVIETRRHQMFPTLATGEIERRIVAPSGFAFREPPVMTTPKGHGLGRHDRGASRTCTARTRFGGRVP